MSLFIW